MSIKINDNGSIRATGKDAQALFDALCRPAAPLDPAKASARKAALVSALDSCVTVVYETKELIRDASMQWQPGDKQRLAVTLEEMGRLCFSVARECERPAAPAKEVGK